MWLATLSGIALAIGALVYLADRDPSRAMLQPVWAELGGGGLFGAIGQWLPSFVHPFAFSLLTAAVLQPAQGTRLAVCATWGAVNIAFECGQHAGVSAPLSATLRDGLLPAWAGGPLAHYFLHGSFDLADIAAVLLGTLAAAAVLCVLHPAPEHDHARCR